MDGEDWQWPCYSFIARELWNDDDDDDDADDNDDDDDGEDTTRLIVLQPLVTNDAWFYRLLSPRDNTKVQIGAHGNPQLGCKQ